MYVHFFWSERMSPLNFNEFMFLHYTQVSPNLKNVCNAAPYPPDSNPDDALDEQKKTSTSLGKPQKKFFFSGPATKKE